MMLFWAIVFWGGLLGMATAYVLYPLLVVWAARKKHLKLELLAEEDLPEVEVIFAAFNEESVLAEKLASLLESDYPPAKLRVSVGSDCSTDGTNAILKEWQERYPERVFPVFFEKRRGKSAIINDLAARSNAQCLCLTDANIIFQRDTLGCLAAGLRREKVGACGAVIEYSSVTEHGIARQESDYLQWENKIKRAESVLWGSCMGLEGGCYLVERRNFPQLPARFFMEDFYVSMTLLQKGLFLHLLPEARVMEDVSVSSREEFKRKLRISIGNFQNLGRFSSVIWKRFWPVGLSFLMHKVLRWCTPFFLILMVLSLVFLQGTNSLYQWLSLVFGIGIMAGMVGAVFSRQLSRSWLKYPGHFMYMNLALLVGFFKFIKGVKSNAWQPTARKQDSTG